MSDLRERRDSFDARLRCLNSWQHLDREQGAGRRYRVLNCRRNRVCHGVYVEVRNSSVLLQDVLVIRRLCRRRRVDLLYLQRSRLGHSSESRAIARLPHNARL